MSGSGHIFISCSSRDHDTARGFAANLEDRGLSTWLACRDIPLGASYDAEILRALRAARALALVLTCEALDSDHVRKEFDLASYTFKIPVLPVGVDRDVFAGRGEDDAWVYQLTHRQWIAFTSWTEAAAAVAHHLMPGDHTPRVVPAHGESPGGSERLNRQLRTHADALRASVDALERAVYEYSPRAASAMREVLRRALRLIVLGVHIDPPRVDDIDIPVALRELGLGSEDAVRRGFIDGWPDPALMQQIRSLDSSTTGLLEAPPLTRTSPHSLNPMADVVGWVETRILRDADTPLAGTLRALDEWSRRGNKSDFVYLAPPHAQSATSIQDWTGLKEGLGAVLDGAAFTAILGAGATQIGYEDAVFPLDADLLRRLELDTSEGGRRLLRFYKRVVDDRLDRRTGKHEQAPMERFAFADVQFELLRVAYDSTRLLFEALSRDLPPIDDWDQLAVEVRDGSDATPAEFAQRLRAAATNLRAVGELPGLGASALAVRLEAIAESIEDQHQQLRLSGAEIEWLTDVFWHSLSFHAAAYPRRDELALQVALVHESTLDEGRQSPRPRRRMEPAAIVYRRDADGLVDATAKAVRRGFNEAERGKRRDFYEAIADAMFREFDDWASGHGKDRPPLALVMSTEFDLEMERAMAASMHGPYHVAVPVISVIDPPVAKVQRGELRWMIGTFRPSPHGSPGLEDLVTAAQWQWASQVSTMDDGQPQLSGPVLVKLNGSPLHRIVAPAAEQVRTAGPGRPTRRTFGASAGPALDSPNRSPGAPLPTIHSVILGEFDFLQFFRVEHSLYTRAQGAKNEQELPGWLVDAIKDPRRKWFLLGLRLADWNSRMQLFMQASRAAPGGGRFYAIQRHFDEDRVDLLEAMGIQRIRGDLKKLTYPLRQYAERLR